MDIRFRLDHDSRIVFAWMRAEQATRECFRQHSRRHISTHHFWCFIIYRVAHKQDKLASGPARFFSGLSRPMETCLLADRGRHAPSAGSPVTLSATWGSLSRPTRRAPTESARREHPLSDAITRIAGHSFHRYDELMIMVKHRSRCLTKM